MNTNLKLTAPAGFEIIRIVEERGYPFTWLKVVFRYRGKLYSAGYKDARSNLNDFEDTDRAIAVYDEMNSEWHHFITNAYIKSVANEDFNGKAVDDDTLCRYFTSCFRAVEELTSTNPL
jgi:hypothetical protein